MSRARKILLTIFLILLTQLTTFAMKEKTVNIAFTIDNNYPVYTLLAIDSIVKNNKSNSDFCFYIIEQDLTKKNKSLMKNYVEKIGHKAEFVNIDLKNIDNGINYFSFSNRITPIALSRIMLPELLTDIKRVLYLDGDILVTGDISELYNQDLHNYPLGMSINNYAYKHYLTCSKNCKKKHFYGNSGVILFDLEKSRKDKISAQMLDFLNGNKKYFMYEKKYEKDSCFFFYPDQDLINVVMDGKIYPLEKKWNNQVVNKISTASYKELGIIHYIGKVKPWLFPKNPDYANSLYVKYWKESDLKKYYYYQKIKMSFKKLLDVYKYKVYRILVNLKRVNIFIFDNVEVPSKEN